MNTWSESTLSGNLGISKLRYQSTKWTKFSKETLSFYLNL